MTQFKVGEKVRAVRGYGDWLTVGTVYEVVKEDEYYTRVHRNDGVVDGFPPGYFELVQPVGPVVTETVTKTRIVPGVYDGVAVGPEMTIPDCARSVEVRFDGVFQADELDAAAAVLFALAKGLRDA